MPKKIPPPLPSGNPESVQIRPFWKAYTDIFETSLSPYEKIILTAVASWPDGQCHYSEKTLARYASCSTKTIQRSIRSLADQGLLFVTPISGTTNIYRTTPWTQSPTPLDIESIPPWTESPDPLDTESTNKNIYKINNKIIDKSAVADAPSPSLSEPHRFVVSELTSEQRATLLALLDGPARLGGHDPEKVLDGLLADCQRYSNGGNDKKRFRACWFETLKRQFVGKKIKDWAARPAKPLGASGLTYQQQQTCFRDFWNEAHGLDRPDLSWLTKEQKAFLQKLMGRLCETEAAYVGDLAKKRSDEFGYQCRDFTNAIKELEQELAK